VSDNGAGIPENILQKIFDPFFTTKEVGKGSGQGLAISHSIIVERHRGEIYCESKEGKGTSFIIKLPMK
jgi:two-component system NtrC family sensor kinase